MSVSYEKKIRSQVNVRVDVEGAVCCGVMLTLRGGAEGTERIASSRKRECGDRACCRHTYNRHRWFFSGYFISVEHIFLFRCDFFLFLFQVQCLPETDARRWPPPLPGIYNCQFLPSSVCGSVILGSGKRIRFVCCGVCLFVERRCANDVMYTTLTVVVVRGVL